MQLEVEVPEDGRPADVVGTIGGELSVATELLLRERVLRECPPRPRARLLLDYAARAPGGFGAGEARLLGETLPGFRRAVGPGARIALLAEGPAVYGCLRMMLAYAELAEEGEPAAGDGGATELFAAREDALAWLLAPGEDARDAAPGAPPAGPTTP